MIDDVQTLYAFAGLSNILLSTLLLFLLWRRSRTRYVLRWALSDLTALVATIAVDLEKSLPPSLNFFGGNVLYLVAGFLIFTGFQAVIRTDRFSRLAALSLAAGTLVRGATIFIGFDFTERLGVVTLFGMPIAGATAIIAFTSDNRALRQPLIVAGLLLTGNVVLSVLRAFATFSGPPGDDFFVASSAEVIVTIGFGMLFLVQNAVYLWLIVADEA